MNINYTTGFNHGYLLQKHMPEVLQQLLPSLTTAHEYIQGIRDGAQERSLELNQEKTDELEQLRNQQNKDREIER